MRHAAIQALHTTEHTFHPAARHAVARLSEQPHHPHPILTKTPAVNDDYIHPVRPQPLPNPTTTGVLHLTLTEAEKQTLRHALNGIAYCDAGSAAYIRAVRQAALATLPQRVLQALENQRSSIAPQACLMLDNLPTDTHVSGSPLEHEPGLAHKSGSISENLAVAVASLIGEPYSISFEGQDLVNNLVPQRGKEQEYTGLGSDVELDFHIENAALKFVEGLNLSPTGLVLTGVRQDGLAMPKTRVASLWQALALLDPADLQLLRGRHYRLQVPYRWRTALSGTELIQTEPAPLISGCNLRPEAHVAFYSDMVHPLNPAAEQAFQRFHRAVQAVSFGVDVTPGRLVYVDNRIALHSRDRFRASHDSNGRPLRWIQRVFVATNLWQHRALRQVKERVFEPVPHAA
jgi:L-asparagine oxygenase